MDSRQRVALTLAHREPDRVPIDYWAAPETERKLLHHYGLTTQQDLLRRFDADFRYIDGPRYIGPEPAVHADGCVEDHWGVPRVRVEVGAADKAAAYREVIDFPLASAQSVADVRAYPKWPDPDWFDYDCACAQVAAARATGKVVVFMGDRMNRAAQLKPAMYLRGVEKILLDLALNPDIASYIFGRIADFYLEYARRALEAAGGDVDIFFMGDDFGTQHGLFMSRDMWRRFLRPGFAAMIELGHRFGCKVAHHTCGSVKPLIPDMIDCGLDILNPVQPHVEDMEPAELKRLFGERLSFHGSISIQRTLPFGTPDDVRREVRKRFDSLGPGGGFIFCTAHNIQADTPIENIEALFDAYRELGRYG